MLRMSDGIIEDRERKREKNRRNGGSRKTGVDAESGKRQQAKRVEPILTLRQDVFRQSGSSDWNDCVAVDVVL